MNQGEGSVRKSEDFRVVSPDRESHVSEGVGPGDVLTDSVVHPAVGLPVPETAVVRQPGDKQVEGLSLSLRHDISSPGGELRLLTIALGEGDWELLQGGAGPAAPGGVAVTGTSQTGASQGTVQLSLTALRAW